MTGVAAEFTAIYLNNEEYGNRTILLLHWSNRLGMHYSPYPDGLYTEINRIGLSIVAYQPHFPLYRNMLQLLITLKN